jgi:DNA-directed RNA polymerase sigma subunit (sigma70/sigma32)
VIPDEDAAGPDEILDREKMSNAVRRGLKNLTAREEKIIRLRFGISEDESNYKEFPISAEKYFNMMEKK